MISARDYFITDFFSKIDGTEREILLRVLKEIKGQYELRGRGKAIIKIPKWGQFLFYPKQVLDKTLEEPILIRFFEVLKKYKILFFRRVDENTILRGNNGSIYDGWDKFLIQQCRSIPTDFFPVYLVDLYYDDLDSLVREMSSGQSSWGEFREENDLLYYGDIPLYKIAKSSAEKRILEALLASENHTLTTKDILDILINDASWRKNRKFTIKEKSGIINDYIVNNRVNRITSKLRTDLRTSLREEHRRIDLVTHKNGKKTLYYELIF